MHEPTVHLSQEVLDQVARENEYDDANGHRFARGLVVGLIFLVAIAGGVAVLVQVLRLLAP